MVDCPGEGAGGGKCYQYRDENATAWSIFPGKIVGFEFWPGAEYGIRVREDRIANPPPGGPDVIWTLLRGLYKQNPVTAPTP
jgi:hypothetical protein